MRGDNLEPLILIIGIAPGLLWLGYFLLKGKAQGYLFGNIFFVFALGAMFTVPCALWETLTGGTVVQSSVTGAIKAGFLLIGPVEEFFKLLAVWIAVYRTQNFREPIDGIIYSTTAAIGFACVENVIYMLLLGPAAITSRIIFATPAHVMFSAMWGYSLGVARFEKDTELITIFKGYLLAVCLHGGYNSLVAIQPTVAKITLVPLMVFMAWLMNSKVRHFRKNFPYAPLGRGAVISCQNCGAYTFEREERCIRCGAHVHPIETDALRYCGICRARLQPYRETCPRCGESVTLSHHYTPAASQSIAHKGMRRLQSYAGIAKGRV